jgi:GNAT superfamily N-acetyltransferase
MNESQATILPADLSRPDHQAAVLALLDAYSADPMGDGHPLSEFARQNVIAGLQQHPTSLVFLAWEGAEPVGLAICFRGFSTFAARPLLNVHDFFVLGKYRGQGLGRRLLEAIEQGARALGCCKLTLEVLENNRPAKRLYAAFGFGQSTYVPEAGGALFYAKSL